MGKYKISDTAKKQFLALLRAGLWGKEADMGCFPEESAPDWNGILYLGRTQAVLPLVYDGMLTLPSDRQLKGPALMKLLAYVDKIEKLNMELNDAVTEISSRLSAEGIRSVLLKGQGLAALYRNPLHRQCGDIDLYVGEENYRKAADIIRQWPEIHDEMPESTKHVGFWFKNMEIELHKNAFELKDSRYARKYNNLENTELAKDENEVCLKCSGNEAGTIIVPPVSFNIFYVFCHAFTHFIQNGLGLRQLCDLAVLIHSTHRLIDTKKFENTLTEFGFDKEWQLFICLIVNSLGLPSEEAPLYDSSMISLSEKLLETIFNDGNFGQHKDLPDFSHKARIIRKIGNLGIHHIMLARRLKFSRRQVLIYYKSMWIEGLRNIGK